MKSFSRALAGQILDLREEKGSLTFHNLSEIPWVTPPVSGIMDFTPYEEESGGGL